MEFPKIELEALDCNEALRYMGQGTGVQTELMKQLMEECEHMVIAAAVPRYVYRVFDIVSSEQGIALSNSNVILKGESIREHLKGCKKAVVMCATLSLGIEKLMRQAGSIDMFHALAVDALASTAIEQVCDKVEKIISARLKGLHMTFRYGIGYGDFPIEQQQEIINLMNASKLIGLTVTESCMLAPGKSVTAVIGVSDKEVSGAKAGCAQCVLAGNCKFRKAGTVCES